MDISHRFVTMLKKIYHDKLSRELAGCKRILDIGCGNSSIIQRIQGSFYSVGVDGWEPYIEESKNLDIHNEYVLSDIETVIFPRNSFDAVICFDVIEHLEKAASIRLVENMEMWASKKVIIATPNGFLRTSECHNAMRAHLDGNVTLQEHKCGWNTNELTKRGYRVRGLDGFKRLREKKGIGQLAYHPSFPLSYFFPKYAFRLLAIKRI